VDIRRLSEGDFERAWQLGNATFGEHGAMPDPGVWLARDATMWGAFADGELVGKATDLHHSQFWDGGVVPASGLAGVAVTPGLRARGIGRELVVAALRGAQERGAGVSTLFCTTSRLYAALGWEVVGFLRQFELPTVHLTSFRVPDGVAVAPATRDDLAGAHLLYERVARRGNGMLTRHTLAVEGDVESGTGDSSGITLVRDEDGEIVGFLSWERAAGYGPGTVLTVPELLATSHDAARALLAVLGTWESVTPLTRFRVPHHFSPVALMMPWERCREVASDVWMHRVVDLRTAVAGRGWPSWMTAQASFHLLDPVFTPSGEDLRLTIEDGEASLESNPGRATVQLDSRGMALLWSGVAGCADLRAAGLLEGRDGPSESGLDAIFRRSAPPSILDSF
jgi:predicted acetyltransferase